MKYFKYTRQCLSCHEEKLEADMARANGKITSTCRDCRNKKNRKSHRSKNHSWNKGLPGPKLDLSRESGINRYLNYIERS